MMEALAAGVIGLALLWLVAQPMLFPSALVVEPYEPPDPEETPRGQALLALKEIEFDRATGKLSEADFNQLHTKYAAAAIAMLDPGVAQPAGGDPVEALIANRAQVVKGGGAAGGKVPGPRCLVHRHHRRTRRELLSPNAVPASSPLPEPASAVAWPCPAKGCSAPAAACGSGAQ